MIEGIFEPLKYLWKTVTQEITDQFTIIKEIVDYYRTEINEKFETQEKMAAIKKIMSQAQHYNQWKAISQHYDKLPPVQQQIN